MCRVIFVAWGLMKVGDGCVCVCGMRKRVICKNKRGYECYELFFYEG